MNSIIGIKPIIRKTIIWTNVRHFTITPKILQKIKMGEDQKQYYVPNSAEEYQIKYRTHGTSFHSLKLDKKYRLGNLPIYQNPLINFVIGSKRLSLAFGVIGCMFGYLMDRTGLIYTEVSQMIAILSLLPFPIVTYLFEPVVSRVWRVYDTTEPQIYENLVKDEQIILEKLNWNGFNTYNELIRVDSLYVPKGKDDYKGRFGYVNLISVDEKLKSTKAYYINDGFTNNKMERILALAEKKSQINESGRSFYGF
jgi:hypothetical protein